MPQTSNIFFLLSGRTPAYRRARRGFTLVEMIMALLILAMICTAVGSLTNAAMNDDRYLRAHNTALAESEMAMRRIANNIREAQTGSIAIGTSTLSTLTQADTADGYPVGATIKYFLQASTTVTGQKDLAETDPRYGTNVLAHNVTTFTVALISGYNDLYQVDLVLGTTPVQERHFQVNTRN